MDEFLCNSEPNVHKKPEINEKPEITAAARRNSYGVLPYYRLSSEKVPHITNVTVKCD